MNEFKLKDLINAEAFAAPNWGGDLASLREDLDPLVQQGYAVALFAGTPKGAAALTRDLADKGYAVSMSRDVRPAKGLVQVLPGHLTAGCTFPFARVAVISSRRHGLDDEAAETKSARDKNALSSLSDIKPGDYVVHQSHGIGMYAGIQRLEVQGAIKDYLKIQYSGSDVLYVPVTQLDLLSRYTAPGRRGKGEACQAGRHRVAAHPCQGQKGHRRDGPGAHRALRPPPSGHRLRLPRRRRVAERFRVPLRVRRDGRPAHRHR